MATEGAANQLLRRRSGGGYVPVLRVIDVSNVGPLGLLMLVLSDNRSFVIAMPTPAAQRALRSSHPSGLQFNDLIQVVAWEADESAGQCIVFIRVLTVLERPQRRRPLGIAQPAAAAWADQARFLLRRAGRDPSAPDAIPDEPW
jgi:hypothetical protein